MAFFKVSDRVTYDRTWIGEAESEEQAVDLVSDGEADHFEFSEEQDGQETSSYEVEEIDAPETPPVRVPKASSRLSDALRDVASAQHFAVLDGHVEPYQFETIRNLIIALQVEIEKGAERAKH